MISDKKIISSASNLHGIHRNTLEIFPENKTTAKPKVENSYEKQQMSASFFNSNSRFLTPMMCQKSYVCSQTMQEMKAKDSIVKILRPQVQNKRKIIAKKLELIGKTVVTAQKILPKIKTETFPAQLSNDYIKKLANVKSKYFSYIQGEFKAEGNDSKRIKQNRFKKISTEESYRKKPENEEKVNNVLKDSFQKTYYDKSISLSGWEQDQ
jgi:hypothetical protein